MTPTHEQERALNRAIAEHEGWKYIGEINGRAVWQEREDTSCVPPIYTRDLNAIVDVVQRWIFDENATDSKRRWNTLGHFEVFNVGTQPALALCLAFAEAEGLDWEKAI